MHVHTHTHTHTHVHTQLISQSVNQLVLYLYAGKRWVLSADLKEDSDVFWMCVLSNDPEISMDGGTGKEKSTDLSTSLTYCPSHQLAYRTATKLLHPCLSLASLWMVPQLWFMFFISASTVLHQVVFGRPSFCFPSGVQWIATLVMKSASLRSTCPIQRHRFLVMMVSISSCWHRAKRSWLALLSQL